MGTQENNDHAVNGNVAEEKVAGGDTNNRESTKGNEDKKIFVGGIAYEVTNDDLTEHFTKFGEVTQAQVKYDRITGRSRGFAFVEFASGESCKAALAAREQVIKNKQVEVKPAKSRENKKVFVGGLPSDYNEQELRQHFEQFGKVEDIEWPFDKQTKQRRNFAFIVFEEEEAADRASAQLKQTFGTRECDVKKAVPQGKRFGLGPGNRGGRMGGYGRGWAAGSVGGYGGWGQMGGAMPYGSQGWGADWFGSATASNYYNPQANGAAAFGAFGPGYDAYAQAGVRNGGNARGFTQGAQQY